MAPINYPGKYCIENTSEQGQCSCRALQLLSSVIRLVNNVDKALAILKLLHFSSSMNVFNIIYLFTFFRTTIIVYFYSYIFTNCYCIFINSHILIYRDWRGLAFLLQISTELAGSISESQDKTGRLLDLWMQRGDGTATLQNLMEYLTQLDRYDIYDDIIELGRLGRLIGEFNL